jgi:cyclophilin family peptidyl-prolyl cis-trans isomerase
VLPLRSIAAMRRLSLLGLICLLAGCGGGGGSGTSSQAQATTDANGCVVVTAPAGGPRKATKPSAGLDAQKTYDVVIRTNCGSFTIRLDQKQSPGAAASIVALVKAGYFDHTVFHRIVPGFVIQGGDPTGTGTGGPGYTTVDKPPAKASYVHGAVAMAKTGAQAAGTAGSQFFVVTADNAGLPPDYAIIGTVTKGLDVVDRIGGLGTASEQPVETVEIEKATVTTS